ncbi:hypothetical protein CCX46_20005 [Pseudomonas sp. RU47]|uniref:hypothetical protein n=1 Tax=Pseudomonas TaxID=286 RepID=UPI000FDE558E|nr:MULTISPECIES: hypothetical protein [Pseudomonas]AZZ77335.1 hypothetical protein CCX46_20005 [Pseudomonas sp. RU47]
MPTPSMMKSLLEHAQAKGSRSNVLHSLAWLIAMCVSGVLLSAYLKLPEFVLHLFSGFCVAAFVLYLVSYVYFMVTNPDALRSEKFSIQKMAIEKGYVGDSLKGVIELDDISQGKLLGSGVTSDQGVQK